MEYAVALYKNVPNHPKELAFDAHQKLIVTERDIGIEGWCKCRIPGTNLTGLVPQNYIRMTDKEGRPLDLEAANYQNVGGRVSAKKDYMNLTIDAQPPPRPPRTSSGSTYQNMTGSAQPSYDSSLTSTNAPPRLKPRANSYPEPVDAAYVDVNNNPVENLPQHLPEIDELRERCDDSYDATSKSKFSDKIPDMQKFCADLETFMKDCHAVARLVLTRNPVDKGRAMTLQSQLEQQEAGLRQLLQFPKKKKAASLHEDMKKKSKENDRLVSDLLRSLESAVASGNYVPFEPNEDPYEIINDGPHGHEQTYDDLRPEFTSKPKDMYTEIEDYPSSRPPPRPSRGDRPPIPTRGRGSM